jgi:RNase P/RNase MRP subunit p30
MVILLSYFELRLRVNFTDFEEIKNKIKMCEKLNIRNIILESTTNSQKADSFLREQIKKFTTLNIYYRYNLSSHNIKEFKKDLNKIYLDNDIISVESSNKEVQIYAARDKRVDILSFSQLDLLKSLTPGIISLVKQNDSFIEFSLAPIMNMNRSIQSKNFRILYRSIQMTRNLKVNYIISGNFTDMFDIRNPRTLISICHTLLDIPINEAKNIFNNNALKLLKRVETRNSGLSLKDDVKIITNNKEQ